MTLNKRPDLEGVLQAAIDRYQEGCLVGSISMLQKAVKKFPDAPKAWGYLGFLYREASRPLPALRCFRKTVELSPKSERASLGLFYVLWQLERFDEALKEMGRFAAIAKPRSYLKLFRRSGNKTTGIGVPILETEELREVEDAYFESESKPSESLSRIKGFEALYELVDA